jgi:TonB family protein
MPAVSIVGRDVLLDGRKVDELPRDEAPKRLDGLRAALCERRSEPLPTRLASTDAGAYSLKLSQSESVGAAVRVLVSAASVGHFRAVVDAPSGPLWIHLPIPKLNKELTGAEWLDIQLRDDSARVEWIRRAPGSIRIEAVRAQELVGEDLALELANTTRAWGPAAPCDDLSIVAEPGSDFSRVVRLLEALNRTRSCARDAWVRLTHWSATVGTPPPARMAARETGANGLPPAEIQRLVRMKYGVFRQCYEAGLSRRVDLRGRVTVRFTIGEQGRVTSVEVADVTDLPDVEAVACIVNSYRDLVFPPPLAGIVTVVYPIMFEPSE